MFGPHALLRHKGKRKLHEGIRVALSPKTFFPLAFRAVRVVSFLPVEGVAFRGCVRRCWRAGIATFKKTGKVQIAEGGNDQGNMYGQAGERSRGGLLFHDRTRSAF